MRGLLVVLLVPVLVTTCSDSGGDTNGCLNGPYRCWDATGDCVLVTDDQGRVTVTWESGATAEGPVGLGFFTASSPDGDTCFERSLEGSVIVISDGSKTWRVATEGDGSTTVTCPGGSTETHDPGEFPSNAPGIDPAVLRSCRVGGICNADADCEAGQVCCDHECYTGERCPGTCDTDVDCAGGNRCCDGWCTSLPYCDIPCAVDSQCDDGVYCNGAEECNGNRCRPVSPVNCSDGISCTQDACNEQRGRCDNQPDDNLCGPEQRCDPETGCEDVTECTSDAQCDDQDPCTTDTCPDGFCDYQPVSGCCLQDDDCDDGTYCNGEESCTNNVCAAGTAPDCADAQACTTDSCDAGRDECIHEPDNGQCTGGQVCDPSLGCTDPTECTDEFEPNNSAGDATPVQTGNVKMAKICLTDEDWFTFDALTDADIAVVLYFDPDGGLDLNLLDESLNPVGEKNTDSSGIVYIGFGPLVAPGRFYCQVNAKTPVIMEYMLVPIIE